MNEDLEYIKNFSKITITKACERAGIKNKNNLWTGKANKQKIKKVRKILESNIAELYILKEEENVKTNNTL